MWVNTYHSILRHRIIGISGRLSLATAPLNNQDKLLTWSRPRKEWFNWASGNLSPTFQRRVWYLIWLRMKEVHKRVSRHRSLRVESSTLMDRTTKCPQRHGPRQLHNLWEPSRLEDFLLPNQGAEGTSISSRLKVIIHCPVKVSR